MSGKTKFVLLAAALVTASAGSLLELSPAVSTFLLVAAMIILMFVVIKGGGC